MRSLLYLVTVILLVGWLIGFLVYGAAGIIHVLLVLALISMAFGLIRRA